MRLRGKTEKATATLNKAKLGRRCCKIYFLNVRHAVIRFDFMRIYSCAIVIIIRRNYYYYSSGAKQNREELSNKTCLCQENIYIYRTLNYSSLIEI